MGTPTQISPSNRKTITPRLTIQPKKQDNRHTNLVTPHSDYYAQPNQTA
ncbi:MAG: hypothetical protein PHX44_01205 [Sulfurimonas sp.]|nr:hypothetical protein [Sulfurimonas sp.]MDD2651651.1 hypothetical protein [Sulfurimonas sp.]MDD3451462.1 hypothetical protein [Sulfurimonas sp.]